MVRLRVMNTPRHSIRAIVPQHTSRTHTPFSGFSRSAATHIHDTQCYTQVATNMSCAASDGSVPSGGRAGKIRATSVVAVVDTLRPSRLKASVGTSTKLMTCGRRVGRAPRAGAQVGRAGGKTDARRGPVARRVPLQGGPASGRALCDGQSRAAA